MTSLSLPHAAFVFTLLLITQTHAAGAPDQLKGKSIVVSWSETRIQREEMDQGWNGFHTVDAKHTLSIYVSTAGRVFSRQTNATRAGSGNIDQVAGEGGSGGYATRAPSFSGQTLTVIGENKGGARRAVIDFDASFASCTAKASTGFEAGKSSISLSPITHKHVEIKSVNTGAASCSVQGGNVLGGPT
jgi:hypothetical protein